MEENLKTLEEDKNTLNKKSTINYLKYTPIVYPILVFLGYINYDFYYRKFDIQIFNYLSINEFLFSFISLLYPVIFLIVAILSYNVYDKLIRTVNDNYDKEIDKTVNYTDKLKIRLDKSIYLKKYLKAKNTFKSGKYHISIFNYLLSFLLFLLYILVYFIPYIILVIGFLLTISPLNQIISLKNSKIPLTNILNTPEKILISAFVWYLLYLIYIAIKFRNKELKLYSFRFLTISAFFCLMISTLLRYQNLKSENFINKEPSKQICFIYENESIESTKNKRFLGMTSEYLFLRDIETNTNYIYKLSNITNLEITTIENQKSKTQFKP